MIGFCFPISIHCEAEIVTDIYGEDVVDKSHRLAAVVSHYSTQKSKSDANRSQSPLNVDE